MSEGAKRRLDRIAHSIDNLQILYAAYNSKKDNCTQAELIATLRQERVIST